MQFTHVSLEQILGEISELPAGWLDDSGLEVLHAVQVGLDRLQETDPAQISLDVVRDCLRTIPRFLDVCRLVMSLSQDALTTVISEQLNQRGRARCTWKQLSAMASTDAALLADLLVSAGLLDELIRHLRREWTLKDVLEDRFRLGRGRAIAGIQRGGALERSVRSILELPQEASVPFSANCNYTGFQGRAAKCDFAVPSKDGPKIVIECKGFEATGSKLTDVLGDVRKIIEAKAPHTYFFLVTDGRGWHRRCSDLQKLVQFHQDGQIDMIYTSARLGELGAAVRQILRLE